MNANFLPNIRCPHCKMPTVVAISGFGGELSSRLKMCRGCMMEFTVHCIVTTSADVEIEDGKVAALKDRIKRLQQQRQSTVSELLLKYEAARREMDIALETARKIRLRAGEN